MSSDRCPDSETLLARWQRLQIDVRCALHPRQPERIALYLHCGARLVRRSGGSPLGMHRRMLSTLLRTAQDAALPRPWRRACVDHAELLLPCLVPLLRWHDPAAAQSVERAVRHARDELRMPRLRLP